MQPKPKLTDAHKTWIRATFGNGQALIDDLEREQESPEGANISRFMAGLYAAFGMSATMPTPDEPAQSADTREDNEHE